MATLSNLLGSTYTGNVGATGAVPGARVGATGSTSTITPNTSLYDTYVINGLATPATIATPSGTPVDGQRLVIRIKDSGSAQTLSFSGATGAYRAVGMTLPSTTVSSKTLYVGCVYNSAAGFWDAISTVQE
jgi:hypothetical protein